MSSIQKLVENETGKGMFGLAISYVTDEASFVEFETSADLKSAVEKLDGREFKGATVHCTPDVCRLPLPCPD